MTLPDATAAWLLAQTLALMLATVALCLPAGALLGVLLARTDVAGRKLWLGALGTLLFVPLFVQAAAWDSACGVTGWFSSLIGGQSVWLAGFRGAAWVHAVAALPWVALIVGCGARLVEPELEEEALLNTSSVRVLWEVTLRRSLPAVGVAALWVALMTAGEITATDLFRVRTFAEEVYTSLSGGAAGIDVLAAAGPLLLFSAALVAGVIFLLGSVTPRDLPAGTRALPLLQLRGWRRPFSIAVAVPLFALTALPVGSLIYKAGLEVIKQEGHVIRQWSLMKLCTRMLGGGFALGSAGEPGVWARFGDEIRWSYQLAAYAATAATLGGLFLAWWLCTTRRAKWPLAVVLAVALAMPGPLVALGLVFLLNRGEFPWLARAYDQTLLAPWLALVARTLPWTTLLLWFALRSIPQDLHDAAALDGARPMARLLRIALPLRWPAVAWAWLAAFVLAFGDLAFTVIVLPPGVETISVRIFRLIHAAADNEVAAVCLFLLCGLASISGVVWLTWRRWGRWNTAEWQSTSDSLAS